MVALEVHMDWLHERGKDMERVTKLHLDEPCPHIPKEITAPFHCTACVLEYLKIERKERGDAS
jgi:hypothetical protein